MAIKPYKAKESDDKKGKGTPKNRAAASKAVKTLQKSYKKK
jgi:hypothetical protein